MNNTIKTARRMGSASGMVRGGLFLLLAVSSAWAQAQNAIKSLTGSVQGGAEVIRIETQEPLTAIPTGFTVQSPARISLDFPGVTNAIGRNSVEISQGNMRSANVVQAGDRTRVVINLKQPASYQATIDGKTLLVVMERSDAGVAKSAATQNTTSFAPSQNSNVIA